MANAFDQFDTAPAPNPFDQFDPAQVKQRITKDMAVAQTRSDLGELKLDALEQTQLNGRREPGDMEVTSDIVVPVMEAVPKAINWTTDKAADAVVGLLNLPTHISNRVKGATPGAVNYTEPVFDKSKPLVNIIPELNDEEEKNWAPEKKGVYHAVKEAVNSFTTPEMAVAYLGGLEPGIAKKMASAFTAQIGANLPENIRNIATAKDAQESAKAWTTTAINAGLLHTLVKHGGTRALDTVPERATRELVDQLKTEPLMPTATTPAPIVQPGERGANPFDQFEPAPPISSPAAAIPSETAPLAEPAPESGRAPATEATAPAEPSAPVQTPVPATPANVFDQFDARPPVKLVPVEVTPADIKAAQGTVEQPPDILDDITDNWKGVQIPEGKDYDWVREQVKALKQNKAVGLGKVQLKDLFGDGEPADIVADQLNRTGAHTIESPDDLFEKMFAAVKARMSLKETGHAEAATNAEQMKRRQLFEQNAFKESRPNTEAKPIPSLWIGDSMNFNGHHMQVADFPLDAATGQPHGVLLQGAYGEQYVPAEQTLHIDAGSHQTVNQPESEMVGMGGAVPSEFANSQHTPTSIKNAKVDVERAKRGLPAAIEPLRRSFGTIWDDAMARIDNDPGAQDRLIDELRTKPRAVTDTEDALLLQRQVDLQNEYGKVTRDMAQAYEDSKEFPNRKDQVEELKLRAAKLSDDLLDLYTINKSVGTETGRGLNARKMMAYEDYSLANMELQKRAANEGRPLTPDQTAEIQKLQERIATTQKAFDDYVAKVDEERSKAQATDEINRTIDMVAKSDGYDRQVQSLADRIVTALEKEAVKARERLKAKFARTSAGVDPTIIGDLAVVGAAKIARGVLDFTRWSKEMVDEFGPDVVPWLNQAWSKANGRITDAVDRVAKGKTAIAVKRNVRKEDVTGERESIVDGIQKAAADKRPLAEIGEYVRRLAENFVRSGIKDRDALIDAVHGILTDKLSKDITRRQAMDAISGYGDFKPLNTDKVKVELRDLKGQMQQVAKLQDIQGKVPLPKSGLERRSISDTERRLIQQVNEAKRRYGVITTDPARQLKSALDAIKTRLRNSIADYEYQLATKTKIVKDKTPPPFDAETKLLELRRDDLKQQFNEIFKRPDLTDAERAAIAQRGLEKSIREYEHRIKAGDVSVKSSKPLITTPELEALRARRDALRTEFDELRDTLDPEHRERAALAALKTRLAQRAADYAERLAKKDFAPRTRHAITMDLTAQRLLAAANKAKQEFQRGLLTDRLAQRPWYVKAQDTFLRWRRGFLLSSPVTLAKLTSAAVQRMTFTPIEEGIGGVLSNVPGIRSIAEQAPREGGFNVNAESKAITSAVMRGIEDAWHMLKTGESTLDVNYGRGREGAIGESDVLPRSVIDLFGNLHGALKAPVKRAEFARSFEKRIAWNMRRGVDVSEPAVQTRIAIEAYKDANRTIFLQDNRVVSFYKRGLTAFEEKDKLLGKVPILSKATATALKTLFPIVRVPSNIVAETFQYATGLATGSLRLASALRAGVEKLPPDQADLILRELKKGSIGGAFLLAGYFMPTVFGGYYQPGEKRNAKDVKAGHAQVFGVNVPSFLLHNPLLETLQIGATVRRVADSHRSSHDTNPQGLRAGLEAGALGLTEEIPFVRQQLEITKIFDGRTRDKFFSELAKSITVPALVQWLAQQGDKDSQGETVARKPENLWQTIETGIPRRRNTVPKK